MDDLKLSDQEKAYYHDIFEFATDEQVDAEDGTIKVVTASMVRKLFLTSNIENSYLKTIWSLCANKKRYLNEQDFKKALK